MFNTLMAMDWVSAESLISTPVGEQGGHLYHHKWSNPSPFTTVILFYLLKTFQNHSDYEGYVHLSKAIVLLMCNVHMCA